MTELEIKQSQAAKQYKEFLLNSDNLYNSEGDIYDCVPEGSFVAGTKWQQKYSLDKLEELQTEYKRRMHDAQAKEDYIYASGLYGAVSRVINLVRED